MTDHHYYAKHYRWYRLPDRAVYGLFLLARSFWRDWKPRRTCATCDHADASGTLCYEALGHGYGQPVDPDGCCERWSKKDA